MKNILLLLLLPLLSLNSTITAQCSTIDFTLSSQSAIDSFAINKPNCHDVEGYVVIEGNDIVNLNGLEQIKSIGGALVIRNCDSLVSLLGLDSLESIGYSTDLNNRYVGFKTGLSIQSNNILVDISSLKNLKEISGSLEASENGALTNFEGLNHVPVLEDIWIRDNPAMTSLQGLNSIDSITGSLILQDNDNLNSLNGLNGLKYIGESIHRFANRPARFSCTIRNNGALPNLNGLDSLRSIQGSLHIQDCDALKIFSGLDQLDSIGGAFVIRNNQVLSNLNGLNSLKSIGLSSQIDGMSTVCPTGLSISNNSSLEDISGLLGLSQISGSINISSNNSLSSLAGLEGIDRIQSLRIAENNSLITLNGLESIDSIVGSCLIESNVSLVSLSGLDNLIYVSTSTCIRSSGHACFTSGFEIKDNPMLTSMDGLNSLTTVDGCMIIRGNSNLQSMTGLNKLEKIGICYFYGGYCACVNYESLLIEQNNSLLSMEGLDNLRIIEGPFKILENESLINLDGLVALDTVMENLIIQNNLSMNSLEGLESLSAVRSIIINENNSLISLKGINNLTTTGSILIENNSSLESLVNFSGLSVVETVFPSIRCFGFRPPPPPPPGFTNILKIARNPKLTDLQGLESIDTIAGSIIIHDNNALMNIDGLQNTTSLKNGNIFITGNPSLTDLQGLNNLDELIDSIAIENNQELSVCDVPPICDHISNNRPHTIFNNSLGCNSPSEVEAACITSSVDNVTRSLNISPNPTIGILRVEGIEAMHLAYEIVDVTGKLLQSSYLPSGNTIDVSGLPGGLYFLKIKYGDDQILIKKFIKE